MKGLGKQPVLTRFAEVVVVETLGDGLDLVLEVVLTGLVQQQTVAAGSEQLRGSSCDQEPEHELAGHHVEGWYQEHLLAVVAGEMGLEGFFAQEPGM